MYSPILFFNVLCDCIKNALPVLSSQLTTKGFFFILQDCLNVAALKIALALDPYLAQILLRVQKKKHSPFVMTHTPG